MNIGKDKIMHAGVCMAAAVIHPYLAVGLAVGKEYGDSRAPGNRWDWQDILADVVGTVAGSALHYLLL